MTTNNSAITVPLRPSEMASAIATCFRARRAPMLHGDPGVGKSELVRQAADLMFAKAYGFRITDDYGIESSTPHPDQKQGGKAIQLPLVWTKVPSSFRRPWFIDFRTALHDAVDLMGVPFVSKEGFTKFATPSLLPTDKRGGVFFYDEINRGPQMTQNGAFSMVLDGSLGEYNLPPNWVCAAAVNDKDIGASKMSLALTRRFVHLNATTHLEDVCNYAVRCDWQPVVIAFLRNFPQLLNIFDSKERVSPNPRAWEFISQIVTQNNPSKHVEHALFAGNVGEPAAIQFSAFLRLYKELPSIDEILLQPHKADIPRDPGMLFAISAALARRASAQNLESITAYLERIPVEYNVYCMIDAMNRDKDLKHTPAFTKWTVRHHEITA